MIEKYRESAGRAVVWLSNQLDRDGSLSVPVNDLACYYKLPYLLHVSGYLDEATRSLSYIKSTFMLENGDFTTRNGMKSANEAFVEYWGYINGWIALTSQKMGRFDIAFPSYEYLKSFSHSRNGGFTTQKPYGQGDDVVDVLTTAHLGLVALYFGDRDRAKAAGQLLQQLASLQPDLSFGFFLRMNADGKVITEFSPESAMFYVVSRTDPNQAYFMIGYPIAFLGMLYRATGEAQYLKTAKDYLDFVLQCQGNLRTFHYSHKVAWGAAIVANLTNETMYRDLSISIADYLLSSQDTSGAWLVDQPVHVSYDQTAEISIWMREISAELAGV